MDKKSFNKKYITFTKQQIIRISDHKSFIDTSTGEPMKMYTVKLPSKNYRFTQFDPDINGIERNDRTATISIGAPYIKQNENNPDIYYTYPVPDRDYTINFKGRIAGKENGKNIFDKPESLTIKGKDLIRIFDKAREISKKKKVELKKLKKEIEVNDKAKDNKELSK